MIRRDVPLNADAREWLLISQVEHARISHQLAAAWHGLLSEAPTSVREEWLAAVLHHDDGWKPWQAAPGIDPEHGRPYGFTEMPPEGAQAIWTRSIDACLAIGPLAGWVVASHFIELQGKPDDDFPEWARWLGEQDRRRAEWFDQWHLAEPATHTQALADKCLELLRQFDWLSLWLCCRAPIDARDPAEPLELGAAEHQFGPYLFTPRGPAIEVTPWPFESPTVDIVANAQRAPVGVYESASQMPTSKTRAAWRLARA
ncbi:MAG: DUF3891 family protein [Planctomycetota bacterium]